jgi:hypothetical protein
MIKQRNLLDFNSIWIIARDLEWLRLTLYYGKIPVKGETEQLYIYRMLKRLKEIIADGKYHEEIANEMENWLGKLRRYKSKQKLKKQDSDSFYYDVEAWQTILQENISKIDALELYIEGNLNYRSLISVGAKTFFSTKSIWRRISASARNDLEDAGRCLLSKIPTSSAMSSLRAAEDAFRYYYKKKMRKEVGNKTWYKCLEELDKTKGVDGELIGSLHFIRKYKRNAASHPGKVFTQKESEKIFLTVVEAIEMMFQDLGF